MEAYQDGDGWDAVADPTRRTIISCLAGRPRSVGDLAARPRWGAPGAGHRPAPRPAVSQHLKVLKDAGLVTDHAVGTRRIYQLNPIGMAALRDQLDTFWNRALAGYQDTVEQPTQERP